MDDQERRRILSIVEYGIRYKTGMPWKKHGDERPRDVAALVLAELEREGVRITLKPPTPPHKTP